MPTNEEIGLSLRIFEFVGAILLLPSSPVLVSILPILVAYFSHLRRERRSRDHTGYLGRRCLVDPYESPAMRVIKYGDDRGMKKFLSLSRNLFNLVLEDFGIALARRGPGTVGRPYSLDSAMVLALALYYMSSIGGCVRSMRSFVYDGTTLRFTSF
jgi:hypothetical protein